ncbi:MAG TPA: TRAP transporter small permease [Ramlibacter sp.]|uniref:TRAP transporter small permease n=1 Tax=Ramlibacter sp. TaxID=1917967 RepID=UPI002D800EED|nr:TRAP transporter small permease [Ramlibacter sp.]HET8744173.1 TRAP transporter small permease [Ramlibacter sp.]
MSAGRIERGYGSFLAGLAWVGCVLLFAMLLVIVADVALRNIPVPGLPRGLAWSNEVSELMLYLITMCVAPWLLRRGMHIRVDVLLQALPPRLAWSLEWVGDVLGLGCCLVLTWYGARAAWASYTSGALNIKTLVTPEWWALAPLPVAFALLSLEMLLRMARLYAGPRQPRHDAVSTG